MASAAQRASRPAVPRPPDGTYAVPDPDAPDVLTLWHVLAGELQPWPTRKRWAPHPPKAAPELPPEERRAQRERWYADTYWPWKTAVAAAIADAPDQAAARFDQAVPEDARPIPRLPWEVRRAAEREEEQAALQLRQRAAAVLHRAGLPYRHTAHAFDVSASTAWRWTQEGLQIWEQEYPPEDLAAALAALPPLPELWETTRPPQPVKRLQEDEDAELAMWAVANVGADYGDMLAELAALDEYPNEAFYDLNMDLTDDAP